MALTPSEKIELQRLNTAVTNMAMQFVELKGMVERKSDVTLMGKAVEGTVSLEDLEATVKVLKFYKAQGFTNIQL